MAWMSLLVSMTAPIVSRVTITRRRSSELMV